MGQLLGAAGAPAAAQLLAGAWLPYWLRFVLMIPLYAITVVVLALAAAASRQRGALQLALFNLAMASFFLVPRLVLGVSRRRVATDLVATPLAWMAYVPFLLWVLQRDSPLVSSGFTACLLVMRAAWAELHRVPLPAQRVDREGSTAALLIIEPRHVGDQIGSGASSVSEASLSGSRSPSSRWWCRT